MASSNKTTNYQLSQWAAADQVRREDFNMDNQRIDTALKNLDTAIKSVSTAQSAGTKIVFGTYQGIDDYDPDHPTVIDFTNSLGRPPKFVLITNKYGNNYMFIFEGMTKTHGMTGLYPVENEITWTGSKLTFHTIYGDSNATASGQMNASCAYYYLAVG